MDDGVGPTGIFACAAYVAGSDSVMFRPVPVHPRGYVYQDYPGECEHFSCSEVPARNRTFI